jgi:hypothetical protein
MIPAVQDLTGRELDEIIETNTRNGSISGLHVYGPGTIGLLNALGYPSRNFTPVGLRVLSTRAIDPNGAMSGASGINWCLLVVLIVMFRF